MPLQAFYDDSGTRGQHSWIVIAGWLGDVDAFARFSDAWRVALAARSAIRYFKLSEAINFSGEFRHWSEAARDEKARRLARCVFDHRLRALWSSVEIAPYEAVQAALASQFPKVGKKYPKSFSDPLFWLYLRSVVVLCQALYNQGERRRVETIFDEHAILAPRIKKWYPIIRDANPVLPDEVAAILPIEPAFRDDKADVPLQAADFLAGLVRRRRSGETHGLEWVLAEEWRNVESLADDSSQRAQAERLSHLTKLLLDEQKLRRTLEKFEDILGS